MTIRRYTVEELRERSERVVKAQASNPRTRVLTNDHVFKGWLGEQTVAIILGVPWHPPENDTGYDGGVDLVIHANARKFTIDVKTQEPSDQCLPFLVPVPDNFAPLKADIYVRVLWPSLMCHGWQHRAIVQRSPVADNGHGFDAYQVPLPLRPIQQLIDAMDLIQPGRDD